MMEKINVNNMNLKLGKQPPPLPSIYSPAKKLLTIIFTRLMLFIVQVHFLKSMISAPYNESAIISC